MTVSPFPADHPKIPAPKIGLLLVNLGTPDQPTAGALRRYLGEFLSDRRVIELSPLIWQPILRGIILNVRPAKIAKTYKSIWRSDTDESPLRYFTRMQAEGLQAALDPNGAQLTVDWAMRYGAPSIEERLNALKDAGCERIVLYPLYPQYSASTSATVVDKAARALARMRWQPALRTVPPHHDHPAYIKAVAADVQTYMDGLSWTPDAILCSFHGLPQAYFMKGDPYHCHCQKTGRLLKDELRFPSENIHISFQSRFGPTQWLQPYTEERVKELAANGANTRRFFTPFAASSFTRSSV